MHSCFVAQFVPLFMLIFCSFSAPLFSSFSIFIEMDLILIVFSFSTSNFEIIQNAHLLLDTTQWVTKFSTRTVFCSLKNSSLTLTHRYVVYLNSEKRHTYCKYTNTEQNACRHYPQWLFMCVLLLFFLLVLTFVEGSICSSMIKLPKFCGCHCIYPYSSGISF